MNLNFEPYYAVIFTSLLAENLDGYAQTATELEELAKLQQGYVSFESARQGLGISVSCWQTLEDVKNFKQLSEHLLAQQLGIQQWYTYYKVRICKVEREYEFTAL